MPFLAHRGKPCDRLPRITVRHDLGALREYLHRFREQLKTLRAYT